MTNKSRENIAINIIDLENSASADLINELSSVEHVLMVRSLDI
jgi:hypothetical protein